MSSYCFFSLPSSAADPQAAGGYSSGARPGARPGPYDGVMRHAHQGVEGPCQEPEAVSASQREKSARGSESWECTGFALLLELLSAGDWLAAHGGKRHWGRWFDLYQQQ